MKPPRKLKSGTLALLIVISALLLAMPALMRLSTGNTTIPGSSAYASIITARTSGLLLQFPNAFQLLVHIASKMVGEDVAARAVPLLFAILSVILLYFILRALRIENTTKVFAILAFVLSPPLLSSAYFLEQHSLALLLFLAMLYCSLASSGRTSRALYGILCLFLSSLGIFHAVIALITSLILSKRQPQKKAFITTAALILAVILLVHLPNLFNSERPNFVERKSIVGFISELGGDYGLGSFSFVLALIGIALAWRFKSGYYYEMIFSAALIIYSFFSTEALVYSNLAVSFYAGHAISRTVRIKWQLGELKTISVILIGCGIVFSFISHAAAVSQAKPSIEMAEGFSKLRPWGPGKAFSHYDNSFWIKYYGVKDSYMNGLLDGTTGVNSLYSEAQAIFHTNSIDKAKDFLRANDLKYIVITRDMLEGKVWDRPGRGLHFLLSDNETFKSIYSSDEVSIWEFKGGES